MVLPPWYTAPVEQTAFNAWACNEDRLDSAVDQIVAQFNATGCTSFTVDDVTAEEAAEIQRRVSRKINRF